MELSKILDQAYIEAFKKKDASRLDALRMLKSSIKNKTIELRKSELTDEEVVAIIRSEIKKRKESIDLFVQGGREELAEKERNEIDLLQTFLPAEMGDDAVLEKLAEVVASLPELDRQNFGKVMGAAMKVLQGVDGNRMSVFVKQILAQK
jgi:hypothetical protein